MEGWHTEAGKGLASAARGQLGELPVVADESLYTLADAKQRTVTAVPAMR